MQALVFIDRDGTINELRGDLTKAQDFELMEGVAQAIYNLNDAEYRVVVATSQPRYWHAARRPSPKCAVSTQS